MLNLENNHPSRASIASHTLTSKFLHWSFTLLYAYGILKQVNDISQLEDATLLEFEVVFAIVFLAIVIVRYFYMRRIPTLIGAPENISKVHLWFARSIHVGPILSANSRIWIDGLTPTLSQAIGCVVWCLISILFGGYFFISRERDFAVRIS